MKTLILILLTIVTLNSVGQKKMGEADAMKKSHIDLKKEIVYFRISGLIEINGYIFKNDTLKCPIFFIAGLDGVILKDTCNNIMYEKRDCGEKDCPTIHLVRKKMSVSGFGDTKWEDAIITVPGWRAPANPIPLPFSQPYQSTLELRY